MNEDKMDHHPLLKDKLDSRLSFASENGEEKVEVHAVHKAIGREAWYQVSERRKTSLSSSLPPMPEDLDMDVSMKSELTMKAGVYMSIVTSLCDSWMPSRPESIYTKHNQRFTSHRDSILRYPSFEKPTTVHLPSAASILFHHRRANQKNENRLRRAVRTTTWSVFDPLLISLFAFRFSLFAFRFSLCFTPLSANLVDCCGRGFGRFGQA
jgi:hypothetical protein